MCGRYALGVRMAFVRRRLQEQGMQIDEVPEDDEVRETYNFAPGYNGAVYRADVSDRGFVDDAQEQGTTDDPQERSPEAVNSVEKYHDRKWRYKIQSMRWGLIPFWTKRNPDYGSLMRTINCRDDSLIEDRGMWTSMKRKKRCIVICQGFYEWLKKGPGGKEKIPHFIKRKDGDLLCFAGLWDCVSYEGSDEKLYTYTIITTSSNSYLKFLHDRMPVILEPNSEAMKMWLDPERTTWSSELQSILKPYEGELECYPVTKEVGNVGNNSPDFIIPINSKDNKSNIANFFANAKKQKGGADSFARDEDAKEALPSAEQKVVKDSDEPRKTQDSQWSESIEDTVTFSSPSALLALGGYGGISPSPAGHDALVVPSMNEHDIQALGMQGIKLGSARDNDEERKRHIEDVVQLLRTRISGRSVCREGIERLVQLEGFESIWQEDNINIAGNFVDLEIEFHRGQNVVKDVSLSYATPDATDGERREEATAVLKRDLVQNPDDGERGSWKSLAGFHGNLQWLSKHDRLSQEVNCFEAIEGLYQSLKRVWDEEQKLPQFSGVYEHLCAGSIGRPSLHKGSRLGLSLDYWIHQAKVLDAKHANSPPDAMDIDTPANRTLDEVAEPQNGKWFLMIECEEGYPSLRVSKEWVDSDVLTVVNNAANDSSSNEAAASDLAVVNWADPPPTLNSGGSDAMALDSNMLGSSALNRRFVARMEPPLDVPILAASDIYRHLGIQLPHEFRMVTYDGLLVPGSSPLSATGAVGLGAEDVTQPGRKRRRMSVQGFDQEGNPCTKHHSYTFQAFESVAGRTMRDIPFSHPRQLADVFPILRQYALLANLIYKIFNSPQNDDGSKKDAESVTEGTFRQANISKAIMPTKKNKVIVLSNKNPNEEKLDFLLNGTNTSNATATGLGKDITMSPSISLRDPATHQEDVKVDVTLRTQLGQSPVIMLLFTVEDPRLASSPAENVLSKVSISLEIGLNGRISVVDMTGLLDDETTADSEKGAQSSESFKLQQRIAKVLEISQDIGVLVEWVARWVRQQKGSG
ncbi:hypothetical protein KXX57_008606 [Aspergillus fumigatus]|nr:hypothetical protein KXX57_008606 [Aspergillus fumigatus]